MEDVDMIIGTFSKTFGGVGGCLVANEDIIELTMTVEEGIKFIISVGIVTPEYNQGKILKLKKDFQA